MEYWSPYMSSKDKRKTIQKHVHTVECKAFEDKFIVSVYKSPDSSIEEETYLFNLFTNKSRRENRLLMYKDFISFELDWKSKSSQLTGFLKLLLDYKQENMFTQHVTFFHSLKTRTERIYSGLTSDEERAEYIIIKLLGIVWV